MWRKRKKNSSKIPFLPDPGKNIPKKIAKKFKKLKNIIPAIFLSKPGRDRPGKREKKNLVPNSVPTRPGLKNSKKNSKKIPKHNSGNISIQTGFG